MMTLETYSITEASARQGKKLLREYRRYSRKLAAALRKGDTPEIIFYRAELGVTEDKLTSLYRKEGRLC